MRAGYSRCNDLSRTIEALDRHHSDRANGSSQTSPAHRDPRRPVRLGRLQVLIRVAGTLCIEPSDERLLGRALLSAELIGLCSLRQDQHPPAENEEVTQLQPA
jgi:hypothetical protein